MVFTKANTNLSQTLNGIDMEKLKRDDYAKCILADPQVLANIVKTIVSEFHDYSIPEIMSCIGQTVVSLTVPEQLCIKIQSEGTEDVTEEDGKIVYDIRFSVYDKDEAYKILINVEAQKSTNVSRLKYHIENRMTYYMARMITSQKNVEFVKSNYDDIKKIYSIWICMDTEVDEDSIIEIGLSPRVIFGKSSWIPDCSLMNGAIIRIRDNERAETSKNKLIAMLELLFSSVEREEKKRQLESDYGLVMTTELEGSVNEMCNISDLFEERALMRGEERKLISLVVKKVQRKKDLYTISDELEEGVEEIKPIYEAVLAAAPGYDIDEIYDSLNTVTA